MPKSSAIHYFAPASTRSYSTQQPVVRDNKPTLLDLARQTQAMRANVAQFFPRDVFRDSAWDMMLELFIAEQQAKPLCVKELILVSGESSTSALRRIDRLEESNLLRRPTDPTDHRRLIVSLTQRGTDAMTAMLRHLYLTMSDDPIGGQRTGKPD